MNACPLQIEFVSKNCWMIAKRTLIELLRVGHYLS